MFAPKLYTVKKLNLKYIIDNNFYIMTNDEDKFFVKEQDNMLFRQIRNITSDFSSYNKYVVFVDCKSVGKQENLELLINDGLTINGQQFVIGERSASMTRNSILSFVDKNIAAELDERITMGAHIEKTVLSKYYAYRGLMLSSCHCIEDWYPKIVIVPDYYRCIPNQHIKHLVDKKTTFIDQNANEREWTQKDIAEITKDVQINVFDGCGIHHPAITKEVRTRLNSRTAPTSILWRAPYIKGLTHEVDYVAFFSEYGINAIKDIWGQEHGVTAENLPLIIMFESMYKGLKYFKQTGTATDWEYYWEQFRKYNHCLGVAKWNFSLEEEPVYTRGNYQILQDLRLNYEDFASLAKYTIDWIEKIINGDPLYTYCFLGLFADEHKSINNYTNAILKNPEMLKEYGVRNYIIGLIDKKKDEMKCGKLYLKGSFKYAVPDLIMALEYVGGLEPHGCLEYDEFFSRDMNGAIIGERIIERNPHICHSEHTVLKGVDNQILQKYCSNLANVCMVNGKSLVMQRMNGGDSDGDLVLVIDNETMKSGIERDAIIVMDIEDKVTVEEEEDTLDNRSKVMLRTMKNLIGEYSNYSCAYHNKMAKTREQKEKYNKFIEIISVSTGKAIDYAKTGILFPIPRYIARYGRPLPYFMRYRSDYYKKQKLSMSNSNMNRLCWEIEKWEKQYRWKRTYKDFDYTIMIDYSCLPSENVFRGIEDVFLRFCNEMAQLKKDEIDIRTEGVNFQIKWEYYCDQYRKECEKICPNKKTLANTAVMLCYEKYPNKNKKFIWRVAGSGVVENIIQTSILLPIQCDNGQNEYLGKRYDMVRPKKLSANIEPEDLNHIDNMDMEDRIND